ncbi:hypothetical protein [Marinobacter sp. HN1S83]|uniref:hypothetical protein n=1 Tax=Marinobacter sp. HN1S83 TaxID=3382301 RepID=UPI00387B1372
MAGVVSESAKPNVQSDRQAESKNPFGCGNWLIGAKITMYALDTVDAKGGWRHLWIRLVEKMGFRSRKRNWADSATLLLQSNRASHKKGRRDRSAMG